MHSHSANTQPSNSEPAACSSSNLGDAAKHEPNRSAALEIADSSRKTSSLSTRRSASKKLVRNQRASNDGSKRQSSDSTPPFARLSAASSTSLFTILEHTDRSNEAIFYDYEAVGGDNRRRRRCRAERPNFQLRTRFQIQPIHRWLANSDSKLLALRLPVAHWDDDNDPELLSPPLLSIELTDRRGHVVFFAKADAARLCLQMTAAAKLRMTLLEILDLLASKYDKSFLAIVSDEDRKSPLDRICRRLCASFLGSQLQFLVASGVSII